jgi:hypothetical protein
MAKSKVGLTPDKISDKWGRNLKASVPYIQAGIDGVTESPMEKAAGKLDKALQNYSAAIASGRTANALKAVSTSDWKAKTKTKVGERMAGGVDQAMPKRKSFDSYLVNTLNGVLPEIAGMPDMSIDDQVNKVRRLMEHMHANPYKK